MIRLPDVQSSFRKDHAMTTIEVEDISLLENYLKGLVPSLISFALSVIGAVLV